MASLLQSLNTQNNLAKVLGKSQLQKKTANFNIHVRMFYVQCTKMPSGCQAPSTSKWPCHWLITQRCQNTFCSIWSIIKQSVFLHSALFGLAQCWNWKCQLFLLLKMLIRMLYYCLMLINLKTMLVSLLANFSVNSMKCYVIDCLCDSKC